MEIYANGRKIAVLMCTPRDLTELAWGHLVTRGLVDFSSGPDARQAGTPCPPPSIKVCLSKARVDVESASISVGAGLDLGGVIASGCGSGALFSQEFLYRPPVECGWTVSTEELAARARDMFAAAELYRLTGGMHCAAIAGRGADRGDEAYFVAREDVGRHNAVDKVIGRAMLDGVDPGSCILLTSGRIAADMALKAVVAGVPIVVSRSIPTTTAYEIAQRGGLTLVGRMGSRDPVIYTRPERIR